LIVGVADGLECVERATADEYAEPREEGLLLRAEQAVAPLDGVAQRLLAIGQITCAALEEIQVVRQAREQRLRREEADSRGRQFNRERQPIQPATDLGDRGGVLSRNVKVGLDRARAFDKQANGLNLLQPLRRQCALAVRERHGRNRELILTPDVQRGTAGDQGLHLRRE
jgi:hypothetical protein